MFGVLAASIARSFALSLTSQSDDLWEMKAFRALWSKDSSEGAFHHVKALLTANYGLKGIAKAESEGPKSSCRLTLGDNYSIFCT